MIKDIAAKLTSDFLDNWSECPIVYDNQPAQDMSDEPEWARFAIRFGDERMASLGTQKITEQNLRVILQIFVSAGTGTARIYDIAKAFSDIFRYYRAIEDDFQIEGMTQDISNSTDDNWLQLNVSIKMRASYLI